MDLTSTNKIKDYVFLCILQICPLMMASCLFKDYPKQIIIGSTSLLDRSYVSGAPHCKYRCMSYEGEQVCTGVNLKFSPSTGDYICELFETDLPDFNHTLLQPQKDSTFMFRQNIGKLLFWILYFFLLKIANFFHYFHNSYKFALYPNIFSCSGTIQHVFLSDSCHYNIRLLGDIDVYFTVSLLATSSMSVRCEAGSHEGNNVCERSYDGNPNPGSTTEWVASTGTMATINFVFNKAVVIQKVILWFRCARLDQSDSVTFILSDGSEQQVSLHQQASYNNNESLPE